jgi:hypothetical protein
MDKVDQASQSVIAKVQEGNPEKIKEFLMITDSNKLHLCSEVGRHGP